MLSCLTLPNTAWWCAHPRACAAQHTQIPAHSIGTQSMICISKAIHDHEKDENFIKISGILTSFVSGDLIIQDKSNLISFSFKMHHLHSK
jgi:hypothetical protein